MERSSSQEMEGEDFHNRERDSFENGKKRSQSDMRHHHANKMSYDEYHQIAPRTLAPIP